MGEFCDLTGLYWPAQVGDFYYNFWQDADHVKGIWRRCTLEEYKTLVLSFPTSPKIRIIYTIIYIYILHISIFYVINTSGYIWIYTTSSNSVCINIESGREWCSNGIPRDGPILWIRGLLQPESSRTAMCSHQILR